MSRERPHALLVLGNLELEARHRRRLRGLVDRVVRGPEVPGNGEARRLLRSTRYLFACNYPLDPLLRDLVRVDLVVVAETGLVNLDPDAARKAGVPFTNLPGYSTDAVTQYVLRCLLESSRPWEKVFSLPGRFPRPEKVGAGLESRSVGLIGFGDLGRRLAGLLRGLGCRLQAYSRRVFYEVGVTWKPLEQLFPESDVVVVCCGSGPDSEGMIGEALLNRLPRRSVLVSVSHRRVFDGPGLASFLRRRRDVTAWLDFDPGEGDAALAALPHVHLSPHLAFYTRQSLQNRPDRCIDQLEAFRRGANVLWISRTPDP
jgi:D-3-phosphoglycerate dehydrogenase